MSGSMRLTEEQRRMVAAALHRVTFDIRKRAQEFNVLSICEDLQETMEAEAAAHDGLAHAFVIADVVRLEPEAAMDAPAPELRAALRAIVMGSVLDADNPNARQEFDALIDNARALLDRLDGKGVL
jgi:hypothetical protein